MNLDPIFYQYYNVGATFKPTSIPGAVLHLDFTNANNLTVTDGKIITSTDLSGNNNNAIQANTVKQPVFTANAINTKSAAVFTGVEEMAFPTITNANAFTIVSVVTSTAPTGTRFFWGHPGTNILAGHTGSNFAIRVISGGNADTSVPYSFGTSPLVNIVRRKTDLTMDAKFNNSTTPLFGNSTQTGTQQLSTVGVGNNFFWAGAIGEIIVYNRSLTDQEVTTLYNHLKSKYNI